MSEVCEELGEKVCGDCHFYKADARRDNGFGQCTNMPSPIVLLVDERDSCEDFKPK